MYHLSPLVGVVVVVAVGSWLWKLSTRKSLPLPPGPKGLPILGNLYDLPPPDVPPFQFWAKHNELYGPISSLTVLGRPLILFNGLSEAIEVLEKQSVRTSTRPDLNFAYGYAGFRDSLSMTKDKKTFRQYRKAMSNVLGSRNAVARFHPMQELEARRFLLRIFRDPKNFTAHLRKEAGAFILKVTYGYSIVPDTEDPLVKLSESFIDLFDYTAKPGNWLVDNFPIMHYLPEWMPGGGFKRKGRDIAKHVREINETPLAFTKHQRANNSHVPSYVSDLIEQNETDNCIMWTASGMYVAGADTTAVSLKAFLLAMILNPDVQRKAQEEIDRVIGRRRLPTINDRGNLPYINAVVRETMRWHTSGPTGLPHRAEEDIVYKGYLIPKDATLIFNSWSFANDPKRYPNPRSFSPERFLKSEGHEPELDPTEYIFGFGRRVCPGRLVADSAMFATIAQTLAVYTLSKPLGPDGNEIEPKITYSTGLVAVLGPFEIDFKLRDPGYEEIICNVEKEHPYKTGDAEILAKITKPKY